MSKYLVYGLIDPQTLMVRYIGKSARGLDRAYAHGRNSYLKNDNTNKGRWIKKLHRLGFDYSVTVLELCESELHALNSEKWWISYAKALGWKLTNHTDGGEQYTFDELTRNKMSLAGKGRPKSEEHRLAISKALTGKAKSPEHKAKVCGANSPMKRPEVVAKSRATKQKIKESDPDRYSRASKLGWTEDRIKAFAEAQRGDRSFTKRPEVRANISAGRRRQLARKYGRDT